MACYPSQHLHAREWGLLEVCLRLTSGGKNPLYFDGRKMAARFSDVRKDAVYDSVRRLVKLGWLIEVKSHKRNKTTQRFEKTVYQVLTHEQWTKKHGTKACDKRDDASLGNQTGGDESSLKNPTGASLDLATSQSGIRPDPVGNSRHNSVFSSEKENSVKESSVVVGPVDGPVSESKVLPGQPPENAYDRVRRLRSSQAGGQ